MSNTRPSIAINIFSAPLQWAASSTSAAHRRNTPNVTTQNRVSSTRSAQAHIWRRQRGWRARTPVICGAFPSTMVAARRAAILASASARPGGICGTRYGGYACERFDGGCSPCTSDSSGLVAPLSAGGTIVCCQKGCI